MARERIEVEVVAKDKASDVLEDVADDAKKLEKAKPEITVTADDDASKVLDKVAGEVKQLDGRDVEVILKAKVDDLRGQLKSAENDLATFRGSAEGAAGGVDKLTSSSDQSRSVMANMAGNTAQDLGEIGGVVGSLGVGIGQLAEYAAEGNISLKNLAAVAGPMAALSVATIAAEYAMNQYRQGLAEARAEGDKMRKAAVDFNKAMAEGEAIDAATELVDGFADVLDRVADEAPGAEQAVTDYIRGATDNLPEAITEHGLLEARVVGARAAFEQGTEAEKRRADTIGVVSKGLKDEADATEKLRIKTEEATEAANNWLDAQLALADSSYAARRAADDYSDALADTEGAFLELITAQDNYNKAASPENAVALADATERYRESIESQTDAAIRAAQAQAALAEEQAGGADAAGAAEKKLDALNKSLLESARTATPEARAEIAKYIADVNGITETKATEIVANADTFAAEIELAATARARTAPITVDLHLAARDQQYIDFLNTFGTPAFVGGRSAPAAAPVTNVTMNLPRGSRADDVVAALDRHARRSGGRTIRR